MSEAKKVKKATAKEAAGAGKPKSRSKSSFVYEAPAKSNADAQPTPNQIAWNVPICVAMGAFFGTASAKDYRLKNKMYEAFADTMDAAPAGATTYHFVMAALDLARVALIAHAEQTHG